MSPAAVLRMSHLDRVVAVLRPCLTVAASYLSPETLAQGTRGAIVSAEPLLPRCRNQDVCCWLRLRGPGAVTVL